MNLFPSSLYKLSNLLLLKLDPEFNIVEYSDQFFSNKNFSNNELKGKNFFLLYPHCLYKDHLIKAMTNQQTLEFKSVPFFENCGINSRQFFNLSIIPDENGGVTLVLIDVSAENNHRNASEQNEIMYRNIFESTADCMLLYDIKTEKVIECNEEALNIFGYKKEEIIDLTPADISAEPDESLSILREAEKGYKVKIPIRFLKKKDGTTFPAELYSSYFESGNKPLLVVAIRDITDRYEAEKKLLEKEEHLLSLVNSTPDIICIKDGQGRWLLANDADIALFDLQNIDYRGKTDADLAELSTHFRDAFLTCIDTDESSWKEGILTRGDETILKSNGELKVYDVIKVPIFNKTGGRKSLIVFGRDITRRKQAEDKLNLIAEQYKSLYENAAIGVYRSTVSGKPVLANKAFLDILGFDTFEDFSKYNTTLFYKDKSARIRFIELAMQNDVIRGFETELIKKDGAVVNVRMNAHVIKDMENNIEYFEGMVEDITEKRKAEQILIKAKEEAEKSDKLKSEFLAQMSHEIRTPINSLLNSVGLIKDELFKKITDDIQSCFSIIDRSSHRIIRTIDSILNMSEIQTGTYDLQLTMLDLKNDIFKPLMNEFRFLAVSKGIKLNLNTSVADLTLELDEYSVKQIFANLIDNAIKFTNSGSVDINIYRNNMGSLNVEVQDTGIGISKEYLPELFKPFTQEEQGYTRKYEGNGLGLALVAKFCEFNGASITVESEKGQGTLFRVNFNK